MPRICRAIARITGCATGYPPNLGITFLPSRETPAIAAAWVGAHRRPPLRSLNGLARRSLVLLALTCAVDFASAAERSLLEAAAVASPDRWGAEAAAVVFKSGGNAVDAAVATAFALAVTHPSAGNLGGGGFMTMVIDGKPYFLDFRERAPGLASRDMYLDQAGNVIPDLSLIGAKSAAVPGTVRGLWMAHQRFARLSWQRDLAPAIRFAEQGIVVSPALASQAADTSTYLKGRTNFERYFGRLRAGTRWRQPELAATLRRIARLGPDGFYSGETANLLIGEMKRDGGLITRTDLTTYRAAWRTPLVSTWRDYQIVTAPPPSSGGIGLIQLLLMKDDQRSAFQGVAQNSVQYVHLIAELEKRVFADRAEYLGDPDFTTAPVERLTDPDYLARRAAGIDPDRPSATGTVGPGLEEHHQTTHYSVIDRQGNAVSTTYTLNDEFGSGVVVEGAGFLLNNEMDDFSSKAGVPNLYGVVGNASNEIAPGKRPLSSMTPTILTQGGKVRLVIGTPGGSRIFTSVFQVICNLYDYGMPLPEAVAAPRFHHQLLPPDTIFEEPFAQVAPSVRAGLQARGYRLENQGWDGNVQAILVKERVPTAASDPRGVGHSQLVR